MRQLHARISVQPAKACDSLSVGGWRAGAWEGPGGRGEAKGRLCLGVDGPEWRVENKGRGNLCLLTSVSVAALVDHAHAGPASGGSGF